MTTCNSDVVFASDYAVNKGFGLHFALLHSIVLVCLLEVSKSSTL